MIFELIEHIDHTRPVVDRVATTSTQLRAALKNVKGEPNRALRHVLIAPTNMTAVRGTYEVHGPRDGRPLVIDIVRGFLTLNVVSGNVVVHADSAHGNCVDVRNDAHATIVVTRERKFTAEVTGQARLDVHVTGNANPHGYLRAVDPDASIEVHGSTHRFTIRTAEGITRAGAR